MKTAFKHPDMQEAGEPCESCRQFWEHQNLPPKTLVYLGVDTDGGIPIVVCSHCDGDWILRFPKE